MVDADGQQSVIVMVGDAWWCFWRFIADKFKSATRISVHAEWWWILVSSRRPILAYELRQGDARHLVVA